MLGTHFFNPVPVMRLLELVRALTTSDETLASLCSFGESLGKRMIVSKDQAGFIVNYLLVPYMLDAIRMIEQGFASREDIDVGMMLGTSYRIWWRGSEWPARSPSASPAAVRGVPAPTGTAPRRVRHILDI